VPGTPQERKRAEIIRRELERYLSPENVVVEEFAFAPAACLSAFPVSAAAIFGLFFTHGAKNGGILPGAVENLSASAVAVALCRMLVASPTLISSHMGGGSRMRILSSIALAIIVLVSPTFARELPKGVTAADLATNNKLFLELARKGLKWEEPADPVQIAGPIYFVGTKGLGAFLITTSAGHILMNTGMPSSGPMIVDSISKLGFAPADIKLVINGHAHIDNAGAFAYLKQRRRKRCWR